MSSFLPLNANEEVRALTCKPVIFESAATNSSLTPSLKYSSPLSALIFRNGNTAIDFSGGGANGTAFCRSMRKAKNAPTKNTATTTGAAHLRPTRRRADPLGEKSCARQDSRAASNSRGDAGRCVGFTERAERNNAIKGAGIFLETS